MHFSVAIPVFNRAHLIERTVDSVLAQDYDDFDLSIVDDASTDETYNVIKKYENDARVKIFVNEKNLGLTGNWNRCIELSKGPLVQIVQSDDLIDSNYLSTVAEIFKLYPEVGFVAASCRYIDINDKILGPGTPKPPQLYKAGDDAICALISGGFPHVSSIIIRKVCLDVLGGYNEKIWTAPDLEMDARIVSRFAYFHLGNVFTSFRRHGSNRGNIEFLRDDYLETFELSQRLCWGYLTPEGRKTLDVHDLEKFINQQVSGIAISGAVASIAYGRPDLTKKYLLKALKCDRSVLKNPRFWRSVAATFFPMQAKKILERKMIMTQNDLDNFSSYKTNL